MEVIREKAFPWYALPKQSGGGASGCMAVALKAYGAVNLKIPFIPLSLLDSIDLNTVNIADIIL